MRHTLALLLIFFMTPLVSMAAIQNDPCADETKCTIDKRRYVEWDTPEYNKLVRLSARVGNQQSRCSAQYVAPNIILSAGHCVENNAQYLIERSDKSTQGRVTLLDYAWDDSATGNDYAIFKVEEPDFYNNNYFRNIPQTTELGKTVKNAGWGGVRVLTDDEINDVHTKLKDLCHRFNNCLAVAYSTPGAYKNTEASDYVFANLQEDRPTATGLKVADDCRLYSSNWNNYFNATCSVHQGNSGGPYYLNDTLYGLASRTRVKEGSGQTFSSGVKTEAFYDKVQKYINENPVTSTPKPEQAPVTPPKEQTTPDVKVPQTSGDTEKQIEEKRQDLEEKLKNIDNASGEDVLDIIFGMSELEYLEKLRENARNMKEREQSTANKVLGAAAIGATGIGGMNLMSGLAEQKADSAAEEDMKAYLATFVCDYGRGRNIKGGETNIETPGGNDMIDQVTAYKALAADLKARKEALGKQPGIEAEIIYDIADTGLYDDVGMGRQGGAYTSLSRALTDENSADADAWAKQKADAASKVKTGAIVAGAGAVGGLIGNIAINTGKNKPKEESAKIIADYEKKKQKVEKIQEKVDTAVPGTAPKCSDYTYNGATLTGTYPDCNCGAKAYFKSDYTENGKLVGCITCPSDTIPNTDKTQCVCANGRTPDAYGKCPPDTEPCKLTGDFVANCQCIAPAEPNAENTGCICDTAKNNYVENGTCKYCDLNTHILSDGQCTERQPETTFTPIVVNTDKFFDTGKATLKVTTGEFWTTLSDDIKDIAPNEYGQYNVCITGQTDPSKFATRSKNNTDLSMARAYTVFSQITDRGFKSIQYKGTGEVQNPDTEETIKDEAKRCNPAVSAKKTWEHCRRVLITVTTDDCGDGFSTDANIPKNYNLYK